MDEEKCKQLANSPGLSTILPRNVENLCKCFSSGVQAEEEKCNCDSFSKNEKLMEAIKKFKDCHDSVIDSNGGMPSNMQFLTKDCYKDSLKGIFDSLGTETICDVEMATLKNSGEQVLTLMNTAGSTVKGALVLVEKIKNIFYAGKNFFSKLIQSFPGYTILYPVGVLVFILMVVIGIFYSILKLFRCIFCPSRKENDANNNEQMKYLQEQYNRTLQTNAHLNNYLMGYQNV
ncbi:PIR protein [Plasmodium ovale]|uniref:PIR protein n=1 Tax=Plasmodium ovale TaxID=36330 RepID=A0A1C3KJQ1_PLAOA|nr:PIR protein [Plasmodium ovale]